MTAFVRFLTLALGAAVVSSASGGGLERFWTGFEDNPPDGEFDNPNHWVDGDVLGVPGAQDTAIFDVPAFYFVLFPETVQTTDRVVVRSGLVNFVFSGSGYTLLNALPTTPSIAVGDSDVDTAALAISGGTLQGQFTDVGSGPGALGMLTVDGALTELVNDLQLRVGSQGAGLMEITGGALAENTQGLIGAGGGAFGDVLVSGAGSQWTCNGPLTVGHGGFGGLTVAGGAQVVSGNAIIAQQESSFGEVVVTGAGSSWTILGSLDVGLFGFGSLSIENGASVGTDLFTTIGAFPPDPYLQSESVVTLSGPGSLLAVGGDLDVSFIGAGRWVLAAGGRAVIDGTLEFGLLPPPSGEPRTLMRFASSGDYADTAAITAAAVISPMTVVVELAEGFQPQLGDDFRLVEAEESLPAVTVEFPQLPLPLLWEVVQEPGSVRAHVGKLGDLDGDDVVGVTDLLMLLWSWGPCPDPPAPCPADLDGDGQVTTLDLVIILALWG